MGEPENVTKLRPLPEVIELDLEAGMPLHSPRETALLEEQTGRSFEELSKKQSDGERLLVWFKLRRLGYEPTWEQAADVLIQYVTPNPSDAGDSPSSPPSAASGA